MQGLEALHDDQAEQTAIVDELLDKIRKSQELTLKDEKLMEQVLKNQQEIEKTTKDLIEEMKQTALSRWRNNSCSICRQLRNFRSCKS